MEVLMDSGGIKLHPNIHKTYNLTNKFNDISKFGIKVWNTCFI